MGEIPRPFTYRLEHRRGDACAVLARAATYEAIKGDLLAHAADLQAVGAEGSLLVVEEAFGTVVALQSLGPDGPPFVDHPPPAGSMA